MKFKYFILCISLFVAGMITGCMTNDANSSIKIAESAEQSELERVSKESRYLYIYRDKRTGYEYIVGYIDAFSANAPSGVTAIVPRKGVTPDK